jgi:hypothetical protein
MSAAVMLPGAWTMAARRIGSRSKPAVVGIPRWRVHQQMRAAGNIRPGVLKWPKRVLVLVALLLLGPLSVLLFGNLDLDTDWRVANRASSGLAPAPARESAALIQVYGARAYNWRGAFAIHSWIATKRQNAADYTVYQAIRWEKPVVKAQRGPADLFWYGAQPDLLLERRGAGVEALIDRIEAATATYPYANEYRLWPGPNSNTFTAYVARQVPELGLDLPPTAIGKDFLPNGRILDHMPSGTGWQVSLYGLLGLGVAREEGVELNVLGLSAGIDFGKRALRLPGVGWLSVLPGGLQAAGVDPQPAPDSSRRPGR